MTEPSRQQRIRKLKIEVHEDLDESQYNSTNVRDNTNCYSHAIGSTLGCLKLYRIGSICGKKPIDQEFFSIEEIEKLLYEDFKVLDLKIEKSSEKEQINDNQYKIALFVKIYADKKIHDYHFLRFNDGEWSEKYRSQFPRGLGDTLKGIYSSWPWNMVGIFKVTK